MEIIILDNSVRQVSSTKDGKPVVYRFQEVFIKKSFEPVTRQATVFLQPDQPPYLPGKYECDVERSIEIRKDRLTFGDLILKPVKIDNSGKGAS